MNQSKLEIFPGLKIAYADKLLAVADKSPLACWVCSEPVVMVKLCALLSRAGGGDAASKGEG